VFDWVVTVGEYVFTVLLLGLAVGYFGTFADLVLYFVNESWVGRGREWGWVIGALGAAIGWPMGWVRRDGKKFSLPISPAASQAGLHRSSQAAEEE